MNITAEQFAVIQEEHKKWLRGDGGSRADLTRADLTGCQPLIYAASRPGVPIPNFYATNKEAIADLRAHASQPQTQEQQP